MPTTAESQPILSTEPPTSATGSTPATVSSPSSAPVTLPSNSTTPTTRPPGSESSSPPPTQATVAGDDSGHGGGEHHSGDNAGLGALRNRNPLFDRYASVPSAGLDLDALTEPTSVPDNGTVGDGQFRMACQYSHFAYDDPIVFPGQPGASHLHLFFGNTEADAHTTASSLLDRGGGSCNGFELNRSAYWTPALLDGRGNAVVPEQIILYYKTKFPPRPSLFRSG